MNLRPIDTVRAMDAIREEAAFVALRELGVLSVGGRDRKKWLHGMITQDVKGLQPGDGRYGCAVDLKGKVLCDFQLYDDNDRARLLLSLERAVIPSLCEHLERRIITEDVSLEELPYAILAVEGPRTRDILEVNSRGLCAANLGDADPEGAVLVGDRTHGGLGGAELLVPSDSVDAVSCELRSRGAVAIERHVLESVRIAAAIPRHRVDFDERIIPLEACLLDAIHWQKGCYLGQEVLARMAHRGHTNKELRLLLVAGDAVPPADAEIWPAEGGKRAVGRVTSATRSPDGNGGLALGYVRRAHFAPGNALEVRWEGGRATATVSEARIRGHVTLRPENEP